jgi:DegV family protein with EDD domain
MDIVCITISSRISATYQNACEAALQFQEGRIKIIDSLNLSTGIGILVMTAADLIGSGASLSDTARAVQAAIPRVRVEFIIDTVEYLHKGGRCSGLQMLLSSLLEIHPIIKVTDGAIHLAAKTRGNRQVVLRNLVKNALDKIETMSPQRIFISHAECPDDALPVKTQFAELNKFKEVHMTSASCVISSHCGPRTIGIIYLEK